MRRLDPVVALDHQAQVAAQGDRHRVVEGEVDPRVVDRHVRFRQGVQGRRRELDVGRRGRSGEKEQAQEPEGQERRASEPAAARHRAREQNSSNRCHALSHPSHRLVFIVKGRPCRPHAATEAARPRTVTAVRRGAPKVSPGTRSELQAPVHRSAPPRAAERPGSTEAVAGSAGRRPSGAGRRVRFRDSAVRPRTAHRRSPSPATSRLRRRARRARGGGSRGAGAGSPAAAPGCTGAAGRSKISPVGASSTTRPRRSTMTRWARRSTRARSWAMNSIARPRRCWRSRNRSITRARTSRSRAETGSSATSSAGSGASARAMPMRWRWPPENWCG